MANKIRSALEHFYWQAHSDGELAEFDNNLREQLGSPRWKERRQKLIDEVLEKLGLPNKACTRRAQRRGAKVVKSKSKISVGRTRG